MVGVIFPSEMEGGLSFRLLGAGKSLSVVGHGLKRCFWVFAEYGAQLTRMQACGRRWLDSWRLVSNVRGSARSSKQKGQKLRVGLPS